MFEKTHLQEILLQYKKDFQDFEWNNEKYKWTAIKHFQDTWNVNSSDFAKMLEDSLCQVLRKYIADTIQREHHPFTQPLSDFYLCKE